MENLKEITDTDSTDRPVIVNNESGCGEVTVNVISTSVTNNFSSPEWLNAETFKYLLDSLGGK